MSDKFKDKCGLFGVYGHPDAVPLTLRGLAALQHRGQESAGLAYARDGTVDCVKIMGPVRGLASRAERIEAPAAIGHVRYGTSGDRSLDSAQPFLSTGSGGPVALGHNGHIVNVDALRVRAPGSGIPVASDSELLTRRVAQHYAGDLGGAVRAAFQGVAPAYSVVVLTADSLCALRDPLGMRPLSIGRLGAATIISSETCALDSIGADYVRDVAPGEIVLVEGDRARSLTGLAPFAPPAPCIFELIYFARPDSVVFGQSVAAFRTRLGERLALEAPAAGEVVVPVPDSAVYGGIGYARASGLEIALALFRSHAVGRTFIEPTPAARTEAILAKWNPIPSLIRGRRVILVDDSIVRGNTCRHLVHRLRDAGAREVHVRITSPPTIATCHFGVDTPDYRELFATGRDLASMQRMIGADSLAFLSLDSLLAVAAPMTGMCNGCFSGVYPVDVPDAHPFPARRTPEPSLRTSAASLHLAEAP